MVRFLAMLGAGVAVSMAVAMGDTWHVSPSSGDASVDGRSWASAFSSIQQAIDHAQHGDTVRVATGTYHESLVLKSGLSLEGGSEVGDGGVSATVLDGDTRSSGTPVVLIDGVEDVTFRGFTVRGGRAMVKGNIQSGGGIHVRASIGVYLEDCAIYGNSARQGGGVAWTEGASGTMSRCLVSGNRAYEGGGVYVLESVLDLNRCVLSGSGGTDGAGLYARASSVKLQNSLVSGNAALVSGGGLRVDHSDLRLVHCTVGANSAGTETTGAIHGSGGALTLENSAIVENTGFGIYGEEPAPVFRMDHTAVADNGRGAANSMLSGVVSSANATTSRADDTVAPLWFVTDERGVWTGSAKYDALTCSTTFRTAQNVLQAGTLRGRLINVNTQYQVHAVVLENTEATITVGGDFSDFGGQDVTYALVDYHLTAGSALVDAAASNPFVDEDMDGEQRPDFQGTLLGIADIGADELVDSDSDGLPDYWERAHGLNVLVWDAQGDPDRDGLTNIAEYDTGRNPQFAEVSPVDTITPCAGCPPSSTNPPMPESRTVTKSSAPMSDAWVLFGAPGLGDGTQANPFSSLAQGIEPVQETGIVHLVGSLQGRATAETPKIAKPMLLRAEGGTVRIGDQQVAIPFVEAGPTWGKAELTILSVEAIPDRADPGEDIFLTAVVENIGTAPAAESTVDFYVEGTLVDQRSIGLLDLGERKVVRTSYVVDTPGSYAISGELRHVVAGHDRWADNDTQRGRFWVRGEDVPEPALEMDIGLNPESEPFQAGANVLLDFMVRNPSFADLDVIPTQFFIDDVLVHEANVGPLTGNDETSVTFPWTELTEGPHQISVEMALPDAFPQAELQSKWVWDCAIPGPTGAYSVPGLHQWSSIGPSILTNGSGGGPTGSVGRIDAIAPHPTNPNMLYAGAPTGGIWRTTNGGDSWTPVGDLLPQIGIGALALDPVTPSIVYACTGSANYSGGMGIFKSIDSGNSWTQFVSAAHVGWTNKSIGGANDIIIRYPSPGNVLIYVGSDQGVLRYTSASPSSSYSDPSEWTQILPGRIADLAVHPTNNAILYASIIGDGIYRTTSGETASHVGDWSQLTSGLPSINTIHPDAPGGEARTGQAWQMAIYQGDPTICYVALPNPHGTYENQSRFKVYRSTNSGTDWSGFVSSDAGGIYSPFLAVHPTLDGLIYFGGVKLYRYFKAPAVFRVSNSPMQVQGIHDDMHPFVWDPTDPSGKRYFIGGDGGIWRGTIDLSGGDLVKHRNNDLRVTMLFDFDASQTDANMMIAGTQDNGTILYQGNDAWKIVKGGDGYWSLIAPGSQVLYAQHQWIETTARCNNGGNCSHQSWANAANGLLNKEGGRDWYMGTAQIACDPLAPGILAAQGLEVQYTSNSGGSWTKIGPVGTSVQGHIARVAIQPVKRRIVAGTSKGQVWVRYIVDTSPQWVKVFDPPLGTGQGGIVNMAFSPVDHEVLYLLRKSYQPWARLYMLRIHDAPPGASNYPIAGDLPVQHFIPYWPKAIRNFQTNAICGDGHGILTAYIGTDRGVYRGETYAEGGLWTWRRYSDGLPNVRVTDLVVDPSSKQLRAATYGRGAWTTITGP